MENLFTVTLRKSERPFFMRTRNNTTSLYVSDFLKRRTKFDFLLLIQNYMLCSGIYTGIINDKLH